LIHQNLKTLMIHRTLPGILLIAGTCAWANPPATPDTPQPKAVQLQDPMPEQALLYLVRIPGDTETVTVMMDSAKVATMPQNSYTAISVAPGARLLTAATPAGQERVTELRVQAGERRFFYLLAPFSQPSNNVMLFGLLGAVVQHAINRPTPVNGQRIWTESAEPEAKGMMAGTTLALPD
jgi:hypothetical protein